MIRKTTLSISIALTLSGCAFFLGPSKRPAPEVEAPTDAASVERGRYLARHVAGCTHCHSPKEWGVYGLPSMEARLAGGAEFCFDEEIGFPGKLCVPNVTSDPETGLGLWSDGEIVRAIREGVSKDGEGLAVVMPFRDYKEMSDADVLAIVAYLRTLEPVRHQVPEKEIGFPIGNVFNTFPEPVEGPVEAPNRDDTVAYGNYLAKMAGCYHCHTPMKGAGYDEGFLYGGGTLFDIPGKARVRASNITPHRTGIGDLTREAFISRFKAFDDPGALQAEVAPEHQTMMPWIDYAGMTPEDLGAIYDYLRTVEPIDNVVVKYPSAAEVEG